MCTFITGRYRGQRAVIYYKKAHVAQKNQIFHLYIIRIDKMSWKNTESTKGNIKYYKKFRISSAFIHR